MLPGLRFVVPLVAGLGLLTGVASVLVQSTTRAWFDKDIGLRARLAVRGSRHALIAAWRQARPGTLGGLLAEITHDERIMAAAACGTDLTLLAHTGDYPEALGCAEVGRQMRRTGRAGESWRVWMRTVSLPAGDVHVSAIPIADRRESLGFVVLVHDLSYALRRERAAQRFLWVAFGVLAASAAVMTLLVARLSWRGWSAELRRFLRGEVRRREFRPIVRDVRDLVERITAESHSGHWTPERLRHTLSRYAYGEQVIVVANREPYIHERSADGGVVVQHPASGLVTAVEPVMQACSGVWVAHGSGSADRETADRHGRLRVPPGEGSYLLRRVWLSADEERGYYYGFSNEGLWPLCHLADTRPVFRSEDWQQYRAVNGKFADTVCAEAESRDPIILVQDYHFALLPRLIRERLPRATIIAFWHIPWPNAERFGICPWRAELLAGMLGSSILGFHTQLHCNNFLDAVDRFMEARIDRERTAVVCRGKRTLVRAYPISLEWPSRWEDGLPPPAQCRAGVFAELGLPPDARLGIGVDRLDYTKGIEERLLAVEKLLERFPVFRGRFTFVQLAAPSRTAIERYRQLAEGVEQVAARVNARFGSESYRPIVLRRAHHEPPAVFRHYRAADVCYVSSLHDGMNLVAKEFVAARCDEGGVLVLSELTGAARELAGALIVNPYDLDGASAALAAALEMPAEEQRERMRAMRAFLAEFNVYRWAGRMLVEAGRLRRIDRFRGDDLAAGRIGT